MQDTINLKYLAMWNDWPVCEHEEQKFEDHNHEKQLVLDRIMAGKVNRVELDGHIWELKKISPK